MASKSKQEAQQPLILRAHRLMEAFAKSDDERDFYLDRVEGFIIYIDLDKPQNEIDALEKEIAKNPDRYCLVPKLTFYEAKKIMEGFVNEKVYDIDTKEKLLDIIQSKEARSNFLEFIYDHHAEFEKWQQYYQERSRIRIIEWLRNQHFHFVFEEDLELARSLLEKLKQSLFESKASKDVLTARKVLITKAKSYYSNEALNPRPKRGRPPKQAVKQEIEPQVTTDIYLTVPDVVRPFLFTPEISSASAVNFSSDFGDHSLGSRKAPNLSDDASLESIQQKLAALRTISSKYVKPTPPKKFDDFDDEDEEEEDEDDDFDDEDVGSKKSSKSKTTSKNKQPVKPPVKSKAPAKPKPKPAPKPKPKAPPKAKAKKPQPERRRILRPVIKANSKPTSALNGARKQKHKRIMPVQSKSKAFAKTVVTKVRPKPKTQQSKQASKKKPIQKKADPKSKRRLRAM
jgi:hypothetical protein